MDNRYFMKRTLSLALKARGRTSPNPMVGAVIVKEGNVVAEGYHKVAGTPHAEVIAIKMAGKKARGATLYVNLEPCCHTNKKTPPCTETIIKSGIQKTVIAMIDPNPEVSGKGIKKLKQAGIDVEVGVMEKEAIKLNEAFIKFITRKEPFVILKIAQSLDGKIATAKGESKWITGEKARRFVHNLRNEVDAVLVGIRTIIKDNPSINCRIKGGRNPYRIVVDTLLDIPLCAKVLGHDDRRTIIATTMKADRQKIKAVQKTGNKVLMIKGKKGLVDLMSLIKELGKLGITSVMIEGGSSISASALSDRIVDKVMFFVAPMIIGGVNAITSVGGSSPLQLKDALKIRNLRLRKFGEDILLEGYL